MNYPVVSIKQTKFRRRRKRGGGGEGRGEEASPCTEGSKLNYRIRQWRLRYFGHVMRMNDGRYPKIALLGGVHGIR